MLFPTPTLMPGLLPLPSKTFHLHLANFELPSGQLQCYPLRPFPILCSLPSSSLCNCHDPGFLKYSELYLRT